MSPLETLIIVNCLLSDEKIIVEVAFARDPSLIHENVGAGFAVASQVKVTFPPSICVVF